MRQLRYSAAAPLVSRQVNREAVLKNAIGV